MPADTITRQLRGSFYRGNRLAFVLAAAGALIGAVFNLIISWLMQQLIDTAAGTSGALPFRILVRACGGFFLLLFCGSALVYCAKPRFLATAMEQYKNCAVTQLTQKSVPDFQRRPSAAYLSALTNDAATIEADYLTQQFTLIQKLFCFAGALSLMLTYSLPLTLAAIVLSMLPFAVSMAAGNRLSDAACRVSDRNRDFTAFLSDYLNGFPVIRSFRAEDEINQRFASENHRLEQQKCTRLKLQMLLESAGSFTGITAQLGIFLLGTWLALTGRRHARRRHRLCQFDELHHRAYRRIARPAGRTQGRAGPGAKAGRQPGGATSAAGRPTLAAADAANRIGACRLPLHTR